MDNEKLVKSFYTAFVQGNEDLMTACYHDDVVFNDPVFGTLRGEQAVHMWKMLLSKRTEQTTISFQDVKTSNDNATATWTARYVYGPTNRKVVNHVNAHFKFKDGKIIEHIDSFNLWKWTQQALGVPGYLLGWTPFMKNKIQKTTNAQLQKFMSS